MRKNLSLGIGLELSESTQRVRLNAATIPFLKWPGGKRWIAREIASLVKTKLTNIYYEPFLGGGAIFFALQPDQAILSDINGDLINAYLAVQNQPIERLITELQRLSVDSETYYQVRDSHPREQLERAVRFLYLNRTAFAGIYRLNRQGKFNVPYGGGERTPNVLWERNLLKNAALALRKASVKCADFEEMFKKAGPGDVVYCDPTYTVVHDSNGFVRYNERIFSWSDQERLARCARTAMTQGVTVFISNAHHSSIRKLYPDATVRLLRRNSLVSTSAKHRREITECLITLSL